MFAITQLAQTTLRSEIGKIDLDRTFEERGAINSNVVIELDKASEPWGVKVLRYEIKNINPPNDVLGAMEKQMRAEREKRAVVLTSEGERDAKINQAEGDKQRVIKAVRGHEAAADQRSRRARPRRFSPSPPPRPKGLRQVAAALQTRRRTRSHAAAHRGDLRRQFGQLAKEGNTLVVPANLTDLASMISTATTVMRKTTNE